MATLTATKTELDQATAALTEPGAGAIGSLECRVADLRQRFLATPATDLADLEARLAVIRQLVATLGQGYLLDLVTATLDDVRAMRAREEDQDPA
jgi:ABC-type iron transport system FetAB ATPase subunit